MAADGDAAAIAMLEARTSVAKVLSYFSLNILTSAPERLKCMWINLLLPVSLRSCGTDGVDNDDDVVDDGDDTSDWPIWIKYSWAHRLTHWGWVTQICISKFTIIGSDNGLWPIRRQAIIWTNAGILLIQTLGTNFSEILIQIHTFSNKKMHLKMSSGICPFCLGPNVLRNVLVYY